MSLVYGSVCSGIEAASVAWEPLGWKPKFFAEIDKFPSRVLAHRFGSNMPGDDLPKNGVPNFGDFTKITADAGPIDLLVGGTPCQSFSVAGKRLGLDDPRGNLALEYLSLARRLRARWIVWENVPGVLSSRSDDGSSDFATFLSFVRECGYGFAYRVLDAQYVRVDGYARAVPQRRRRVFVVGYLGDWRRAAAVLLEPEGMRGDTPPRRQSGQRPAPTLAARTRGGGGLGTDFDLDGGLISMAHGQAGAEICLDHGPTLSCNHEAPIVAHALRAEGFDASEDGTGRGTPIVPVAMPLTAGMAKSAARMPHEQGALIPVEQPFAFDMRGREEGAMPEGPHDIANIRAASGGSSRSYVAEPVAFDCLAAGKTGFSVGEVPGALHGGGKSGGRAAVAFSCKDYGADAADEVSPTMRAMGHGDSHANAGGQLAVAFQDRVRGDDGRGYDRPPAASLDVCGTLETVKPFNVALPWAVRRLTPRECERLQGFPDDFTAIPRGNKPVADGPRYKALGNSMAVNVMRWIGERIDLFERLKREGWIP